MNNKTYSEISNTMIDAVEIIADKIIEQAQFDKTITGIIEEVIDSNKGKYKIKYQDSSFYATVEDPTKTVPLGAEVYVLVPRNDFSKNKKIIGTVKDLKEQWSIVASAIERYEDVGINIIELNENKEWSISSYTLGESDKNLSLQDFFTVNENGTSSLKKENELKYYLSNSDYLEFSADFSTNIENNHLIDSVNENQTFPNFGLKIIIGDENSEKEYILDTEKMEGSPFNLLNFKKQKVYFEIDKDYLEKENFKIKDIILFQTGFKGSNEEEKRKIKDIIVKNISLKGVKEISLEKYNTYSLHISAPRGEVVYKDTDKISLIANILFQGSINKLENTKYYWGKEDIFTTSTSLKYNKNLGAGWSFIKEGSQLDLIGKDVLTTTKFKCVAIYENTNYLESEVVVKVFNQNPQSSAFNLKINSSNGQYFHNSEGETTLSVVMENLSGENQIFSYKWIKIDRFNNILNIDDSSESIKVFAKDINRNITYKCGLIDFETEEVLGVASIELYNLTKIENKNITLYNGNQTFLYDIAGKSPCSEGNLVKQILLPLSFDYYDDNGKQVPKSRLSIVWKIPKKNSMLKSFFAGEEVQKGDDDYFILESHDDNISFTIKENYYFNYNNNNIILEVVDKNTPGKKSIITTNFTFLKQGESGTNGTDLYGVIDLKNNEGQSILGNEPYPIFNFTKNTLNGYSLSSDAPYFEAALYRNGEIVEGECSFEWTVVGDIGQEKYSSSFNIISLEDNKCSITKNTNSIIDEEDDRENRVIRAVITYEEKSFYVEMPIVEIRGNTDDIVKIKPNTGFNKVMYAADGSCPQYAMIPFEYEIKNGYQIEEIKSYSGYSTDLNEGVDFFNIKKENGAFRVIPPPFYYGKTNDSGIYIKAADHNGKNIFTMHFPIYLYLNKFGYSALNGWDGNSIQINKEENYILSPQIGAGRKNDDNTFTGLLMGEMTNKDKNNDIGLLGFHNGVRTIFLDANTGKAVFGSNVKGQIILDPTNDAIIESGDPINDEDTGLHINLTQSIIKTKNYEEDGEGLEINFAKPEIKFGSKNFSLNKNGDLYSVSGEIGGWTIENNHLFSEIMRKEENIVTEVVSVNKEKNVEEITVVRHYYHCIQDTTINGKKYSKGNNYGFTVDDLDGQTTDGFKYSFPSEKNSLGLSDAEFAACFKVLMENVNINDDDGKNEDGETLIEKEVVLQEPVYNITAIKQEEEIQEKVELVQTTTGNFTFLNSVLDKKNTNPELDIVFSIGATKDKNGQADIKTGKSLYFLNGNIQTSKLILKNKITETGVEFRRDKNVDGSIKSASLQIKYDVSGSNSTQMMFYWKDFNEDSQKKSFTILKEGIKPESSFKNCGLETSPWENVYTKNLDLTGNIAIGQSLQMKDPKYPGSEEYSVLTLRNSGTNNNTKGSGADLYISGNARVILGSGESSEFLYNKYIAGKSETISKESLFLASDSWMKFYINCDGKLLDYNNINNMSSNNKKKRARFIELMMSGVVNDNETQGKTPYGPALRPDINGHGYLGTDGKRWRRIYTDNIKVSNNILIENGNITIEKGNITINKNTVATQTWVNDQGFATQSWVNEKKYLTSSSLSDYATESWVKKYYAASDHTHQTSITADQIATAIASAGETTKIFIRAALGVAPSNHTHDEKGS